MHPAQTARSNFHVRARPGGWVSAALVRRLQVGEFVRIGEPHGTMTLDEQSNRDIVCVAGGTGLAPIKSLVEDIARNHRSRWVHVFIGARTREDLYDLPALNRLASRWPWLSVVVACSEDPTFPGEIGPINEVVERYGPWPDHDFFVCGPPPMVQGDPRFAHPAGDAALPGPLRRAHRRVRVAAQLKVQHALTGHSAGRRTLVV